jgi:hypothetical protein
MENIKKSILEKNPMLKMKKFEFLELDYCELFGNLVPDYITKLRGIRIWKDDENYSIQENTIFTLGLNEEQVIKRIEASYERFERVARAEKQAREAEEERQAREKIAELKAKIAAKQDLPKETLEFLTSILN